MSEIDPKLSRLYRAASTEGPPPALDAAILAAARARGARPERRARASWLAWMAPASAVATLVLGVSVALMVEHEQPEPGRATPLRPITARPQSAPPAPAAKATGSTAAAEANRARDATAGSNAAAAAAPAAAGKLAPPGRAAALRSAPAWLEEIGRLKRDGREREAAEQLAQFRKAYPDYPLPASLRRLE